MAKQLNSEQRYVIYVDLQSKLTKKSELTLTWSKKRNSLAYVEKKL